MIGRHAVRLMLGLALAGDSVVWAAGPSSTNYAIPASTQNSGVAATASASYGLSSSLGDPFFTGPSASPNYLLAPGFWGVTETPAGANAGLSVALAGRGSVTSNPLGIACGTVCSAGYATGTNVSLLATPAAGSAFTGWSDACAGTGTCVVAMSVARNLMATFTFVGAGSANANDWVQKAYVAYYGRPADPAGLAYWADRMDKEGGSLQSIIDSFGISPEFIGRYGNLTYSQLIDTLYQQTLGRGPDPAGKQWYLSQLNAGLTTPRTITLDLLGGATGLDTLTVANRLDVANHFTGRVTMGCPYAGELTGVASLAPVTYDAATVWTAKLGIENRCGP